MSFGFLRCGVLFFCTKTPYCSNSGPLEHVWKMRNKNWSASMRSCKVAVPEDLFCVHRLNVYNDGFGLTFCVVSVFYRNLNIGPYAFQIWQDTKTIFSLKHCGSISPGATLMCLLGLRGSLHAGRPRRPGLVCGFSVLWVNILCLETSNMLHEKTNSQTKKKSHIRVQKVNQWYPWIWRGIHTHPNTTIWNKPTFVQQSHVLNLKAWKRA